jgi:site-specific DNA-methyltransferase (adenine-specific)
MVINKVLHGDCLELMHDIPDGSIDMILCDLPYGTTACSWDIIIPFEPLWSHYKRIIKPNGAIVLTACQPFTSKLIMSNIEMFKYCMIWEKPQGVDPFMAKIRPLNNYEDIIVFAKAQPTYNPQVKKGTPYTMIRDRQERKHEVTGQTMKKSITINEGSRLPARIIQFKQERGYHPTQKPVPLAEYLIRTYTNKGDTVLDNCAGGGWTGVACIKTDRNYILMEQEKKYIDIINKRIDQETAQGRLF